jgi:hypothetical protein
MNASRIINHSRLLLRAGAVLSACLSFAAFGAPGVLDTAINPANNHVYYLLANSNWTNAESAAVALGGTLATVNDSAENNWILDRWGTNRSLWIGLYDPIIGDGGGAEHEANFVWASGLSSGFRNWRPGEPNGDRYTYMYPKSLGGLAGLWNDTPNLTTPGGSEPPLYGVVEVEFCSPHHATAIASNINGFVVGANMVDFGCGYTNPPLVLIHGGGGSGATATAIMSGDHVIGLNITAAGSGYTNNPTIVIASPPFVPTVGIRVSKVEVTQNVVLGLNYVLESSFDLINWTPTGPPFTATEETIVNEFSVDQTGRYFRLRQVP